VHGLPAKIIRPTASEHKEVASALLPSTFHSTLTRGLLAGVGLGFIETTLTYLTGSAPTADALPVFGIATVILLMASAALSPLVRSASRGKVADAVLLGLPVLVFGLRGCLFGCDIGLASALLRWTPTLLLLTALLIAVVVRQERLAVGAFATLALGTQFLAALAFGVRTDQYPAINLRVIILTIALAGMLLTASSFLWRRRDLSGRVVVLHLTVVAIASVGVATTLGSAPPQLETVVVSTARASVLASPNVVLIVMDTVRSDHLNAYGYARETAPHLEALAAHSLVFERATANATYSLASHASLLTGLLPSQHGAHLIPNPWARMHPMLNLAVGSFAVRREASTVAEYLHSKGYATAGISANDVYLAEWTGLQRGFDLFEAHARRRYRFAPTAAPIMVAAQRLRDEPFNTQDTWAAAQVVDAAIDWVSATPQPFFLFLNLFDAHEPYTPPGGSPFRGDGLGSDDHEIPEYDAEIRIVDREIGRLLDRLRSRGLFDGSLVVVTSDHGQYFGEHGLAGHTHQLYEPVLRVPLLVKLPGQSGPPRWIKERIGLHEVRRIVESVVKREPLGQMVETNPTLIAESWAENREDLTDPESIRPGAVAVYWGDWKLIHRRWASGDELFNLRSDPDEAQNLLIRPAPGALEVGHLLAGAARTQNTGPGAVPEVPTEALERLRALGYVN
jgi:arylsulfatase A-like enzyme